MQSYVSYISQYCPDCKKNVPVKKYLDKDGKECFECLNKQYCINENSGCTNKFVQGYSQQNQLL